MLKLLSLFSLLVFLAGCQVSQDPANIRIGSQSFHILSTKRSEAERAEGLMYEKSIAENHGMLFVFPHNGKHGFWMKNTIIPLDIIWISEDMEVVAIKRNAQPCLPPEHQPDLCTMFIPKVQARYAFEVKANTFLGRTGDKVKFEY